MISKTMVLCLNVVLYACGENYIGGNRGIIPNTKKILGLNSGNQNAKNIVEQAGGKVKTTLGLPWQNLENVVNTTGVVKQAIKTANDVLAPPRRVLDYVVNISDVVDHAREKAKNFLVPPLKSLGYVFNTADVFKKVSEIAKKVLKPHWRYFKYVFNIVNSIKQTSEKEKNVLPWQYLDYIVNNTDVEQAGEIAEGVQVQPWQYVGNVVNTTDVIEEAGATLISLLLKGVGNICFSQGWDDVKTFKAPEMNYIMFFPNSVVAIADVGKQEAWFVASVTRKTVLPTDAWTIYSVLNGISSRIGPIIRGFHMDCIKARKLETRFGEFIVDKIRMQGIQVCDFASMRPTRNVTITRDTGTLMNVVVPYVIDSLTTDIRSVNITDNYFGLFLENTPMTVEINDTLVRSEVFFWRGTAVRFMKIKMSIQKLGKFNIKINIGDNQTNTVDFVDDLWNLLSSVVLDKVNRMFKELEREIRSVFMS